MDESCRPEVKITRQKVSHRKAATVISLNSQTLGGELVMQLTLIVATLRESVAWPIAARPRDNIRHRMELSSAGRN